MTEIRNRPVGSSAEGLLGIFADSYNDGEIRALAQEPVQNAKDARLHTNIVRVEYRLTPKMDIYGNRLYVLTVTDSGTTGLSGTVKPSKTDLARASDADRATMKWYHFERMFDSKKGAQSIGSRGWGKSIFLHCSNVPGDSIKSIMLYDTLTSDSEYRFGRMMVLNDDLVALETPLTGMDARKGMENPNYVPEGARLALPLASGSLNEPGTRIVVPYLRSSAVKAFKDGSLIAWLQYLWWRPISEGDLTITVIDDETKKSKEVTEPPWWERDSWSADALTRDKPQNLFGNCWIQVKEDIDIGKRCTIQTLALTYDPDLSEDTSATGGPSYAGIQMLRAGQCIQTFWDFDRIPNEFKPHLRGFVEFDADTDVLLRKRENSQHDGFDRRSIMGNPIIPRLQAEMESFALAVGLIKQTKKESTGPSDQERQTVQFVIDKLLSGGIGKLPNENPGDDGNSKADRPWDIDILLSYPNPSTTKVNWRQRITNIHMAVNASPDNPGRNLRFAIEWLFPDGKLQNLREIKSHVPIQTMQLRDLVLVSANSKLAGSLQCQAGVHRIRAAVYSGKKLVAKKARRVHVEMDPPERPERPYTVSISAENVTSIGDKRIEHGDKLRLQINGRNRTLEDCSAELLLRMHDGERLLFGKFITMKARRLGESDIRHDLHRMEITVVRSDDSENRYDSNSRTLSLVPGRQTLRCYLVADGNELADGPHTLHFEVESPGTQRNSPFEPARALNKGAPMWRLDMSRSTLIFAPDNPLYRALESHSNSKSAIGNSPYLLEVTVNGLLEWALEPLLEEGSDNTNIEALRASKTELVDDAAWDNYMDRLSELESQLLAGKREYGSHQSPIEFALTWRKAVAAAHQVLSTKDYT